MYFYKPNSDLLCQTLESHQEKIINNRFIELINFWGKYKISDNVRSPEFFSNVFSNSIVNIDDINRVMLRKYCLSNHKEDSITNMIDQYILQGDFSEIDYLLSYNQNVRSKVFDIYLDNINISNGYLAIENIHPERYDETLRTLDAINTFYTNKAYNNSRNKMYMKTTM